MLPAEIIDKTNYRIGVTRAAGIQPQ